MKTVTIEEFRAHLDDYLTTSDAEDVVITSNGCPCGVFQRIHDYLDEEDLALATSQEFWEMIQARRQEKGIPWEAVKKELGLDKDCESNSSATGELVSPVSGS